MAAEAREAEPGRLGIIAGSGSLPLALARAAREAGREVFVLTIEGVTDADFSGFETGTTGLTTLGRAEAELKRGRCRDVTIVGSFRRPDYAKLDWDWGTVKFMPRLLKMRFGGDDSVNTAVSNLVESVGFRMVSPASIAPSLVAAQGLRAGRTPTKAEREDIEYGIAALVATGAVDIGQALVVSHRRILAVEAAEGTDAMILRCVELRRNGRFREAAPSGILVKAAKPGQNLRMDLPTVGSQTVRVAIEAGLAGIALHEGHVLMPDRDEALRLAEENGLFVVSVEMPAAPGTVEP